LLAAIIRFFLQAMRESVNRHESNRTFDRCSLKREAALPVALQAAPGKATGLLARCLAAWHESIYRETPGQI
jgi:hypothetical protein